MEKPKIKRPHRRKIELGIEKVTQAVRQTNEIFKKMSDRQRRLFIALSTGNDSLKSCLMAGDDEFQDIAKVVYTKDGNPMKTKDLTAKNVDNLDVVSYERLLRICDSRVNAIMDVSKFTDYVVDLNGLFRLIAPDALNTMVNVMTTSKSDQTRLQAATGILDRSGYAPGTTSNRAPIMPVQVNILFGEKPQAEDVPKIDYVNEQSEEEIVPDGS